MTMLAFAQSIQLFPDGTLFLHIILILVMIWVLNRTFFSPINRVIEEREKRKGKGGSEAEDLLREAERKESEIRAALLAAREEGYQLIEKMRSAAVEERQRKIAEAKALAAAEAEKAKKRFQEETSFAKAEAENDAEELAEKIAATILRT